MTSLRKNYHKTFIAIEGMLDWICPSETCPTHHFESVALVKDLVQLHEVLDYLNQEDAKWYAEQHSPLVRLMFLYRLTDEELPNGLDSTIEEVDAAITNKLPIPAPNWKEFPWL